MGHGRNVFLLIAFLLLFSAKFLISLNMPNYVIFPDEQIYGNKLYGWNWGLLDFNVYSIVPLLFGRFGALTFNCIISTACIVPLFILFRKNFSERTAALLSVFASLYAPLWYYSLTNMAEATLYFVTLMAAASYNWGYVGVLVKRLGLSTFLARQKYGFLIAVAISILFSQSFGAFTENPLFDFGMNLVRAVSYIFLASVFTFSFALYRCLKGEANAHDKYAINHTLVVFGMLYMFFAKIPYDWMFGRYWDSSILLLLTTLRPMDYNRKELWLLFGALAIIASAYVLNNQTGLMDAGLMPFYDVCRRAVLASNRIFD